MATVRGARRNPSLSAGSSAGASLFPLAMAAAGASPSSRTLGYGAACCASGPDAGGGNAMPCARVAGHTMSRVPAEAQHHRVDGHGVCSIPGVSAVPAQTSTSAARWRGAVGGKLGAGSER